MECHVDANGCLDWVGINSGELSEVGLAEPTSGRGAVRHREGTVASIQSSGHHVDPRGDYRCNVLQEVVRCTEAKFFWDLKVPCKTFV